MDNNYKLVAIDMDGTLLNSKSEVTPFTGKVINELTDRGIIVVFVTGRLLAGVKIFPQIIKSNRWVIACNGAYTINTGHNSVSFDNPLRIPDCMKIVKLLKSNSVIFQYLTFDQIVGEKIDKRMKYYYEVNSRLPEKRRIRLRTVDNCLEAIQKEKSIYKILMNLDCDDEFHNILRQINEVSNVSVYKSGKGLYDMMNKGVSKGAALEMLAGTLKIKRDEIIAIGDSQNDISMLEFAGTAIAMGNADEEVKKAAGYLADTCDNDGAARILKELLLS